MKRPRYAFEADFLRFIREFKDGITFFEFSFNLDCFEADHNPQFTFMLIFLNLKVFEFNIYNIHHVNN